MKAEDEIRITRVDPWFKAPAGPTDRSPAIYLGRYDLPIGMAFTSTEALFLSGGPDGWNLWVGMDEQETRLDLLVERVAAQGPGILTEVAGSGLVVSGALQGSPQEAARTLFRVLLRARVHHSLPCAPYQGGLLSAEELSREVSELKAELERNDQAAMAAQFANPSPIIQVATAFGLEPRPAGHDPDAWWASCPGGNHSLMITASPNQFGCGYCRRKGGPEELRTFCEDRGRKEATTVSSLAPILRALERVDYIISCLAEKCGGQAKRELDDLARALDSDPRLSFKGSDQVLEAIRSARRAMVNVWEYGDAICKLGKLSGDLWKTTLAGL